MKLEPTSQAERHLNQEFEMYKLLGAASDFTNDIISEMHGISHVYYYGSFLAPHFNIIIMTLLDRNLNNIFEKCRREFTRETIIMIFLQAVSIIKLFLKKLFLFGFSSFLRWKYLNLYTQIM